MKELVEFVSKSHGRRNPTRWTCSNGKRANLTVLELRVAKEDYGKIIGKQGRTVKALRGGLLTRRWREERGEVSPLKSLSKGASKAVGGTAR
jgi:predicted RNA-binding protein YlqC (UPF0109 family)